MRVAICGTDQEEKEKLCRLLAEYSRQSGLPIEIEEYGFGLLPDEKSAKRRLAFSFVEGKIVLRAGDIIYVETSRHKNLVYTADRVYGLYKKLDEIERQLSPYGFVRVHLSYLVNMRYVEGIKNYVLYLKGGKEIPVPKSRYSYVKEHLELFWREWETEKKAQAGGKRGKK